MRFAFGGLLDDIGRWLVLGVILAGLISVFMSPHFIEVYLGSGLFSMLVMLVISTPLYVCATASTPIAAALVLKGLNPGAALVFLLAGPATNVATITVVLKVLGKKATIIYLSSILICSLALGLIINEIYRVIGFDITSWVVSSEEESLGIVSLLTGILLILLVLKGVVKQWFTTRLVHAHSVAE